MTADHLDNDFSIPEAMEELYQVLRAQGFVNITPPTPDEWDHPAGVQVRIAHVARTVTIRYRNTPPEPAVRIPSVEGQRRYDATFPWSSLHQTHYCSREEFVAFLLAAGRTIATALAMRQAQSA